MKTNNSPLFPTDSPLIKYSVAAVYTAAVTYFNEYREVYNVALLKKLSGKASDYDSEGLMFESCGVRHSNFDEFSDTNSGRWNYAKIPLYRRTVLKQMHDEAITGHLAYLRTYLKVKNH
ncbi:hypothetical protein OUZ56_012041 [Daphnia magna]|uniref:Uncharacterized protein n=1 Tax=Daphnia magna TaxID=35525 RepID=A0ABQ9Z1V8_9CRUS|nr:hypothetical protein OUZ56_012041 [Daphnia magna]